MAIIIKVSFEIVPSMPGLPVSKDIEPARYPGWTFEVQNDRLVITAPAGHLESPIDSVREELAALGKQATEAVHVLSEPLSRVRLLLLEDGRPQIVGPSAALRNARHNAAKLAAESNAKVAAAPPEPTRRKPGPKPKPLAVPPGFRGNPTPPPSPPEEDAPDEAA
jgi:hypothetical protein